MANEWLNNRNEKGSGLSGVPTLRPALSAKLEGLKRVRVGSIFQTLNHKIERLNREFSKREASTCVVELTGELSSLVTFGIAVAAAKTPGSSIKSIKPLYLDSQLQNVDALRRIKHVSYIFGRDLIKVPLNSIHRTAVKELNMSIKTIGGKEATGPLKESLKSSCLQYMKSVFLQDNEVALLLGHQSLLSTFEASPLQAMIQPYDLLAVADMLPFEIKALADALGLPDSVSKEGDISLFSATENVALESIELWAITQGYAKEQIAQLMQYWSIEDCAHYSQVMQQCNAYYRASVLRYSSHLGTIL